MSTLVNKRAKEIMITSVSKDMILPLVIRVCTGVLSFFLTYYAIKYVPIFIVSLVINTTPIFTSVLAFIFLKERVLR